MEARTVTSKETNSELPGPKGLELYLFGAMLQRKPLETYIALRETYGDLVWCPWPGRESLFLFSPTDLKHVMKDNQTNYTKSKEYVHLKPLLGEGLLTSEDEHWRHQRRIVAREFHGPAIEHYADSIRRKTDYFLQQLKARPSGEAFDLSAIFASLTFQIAGEIFFGASVEDFSEDVNHALTSETERINNRMRRLVNIPFVIPTPENLRGKEAISKLDQVVNSIIKSEKTSEQPNVLTKLKGHKPELPTKSIRDEVMTLLLAGHETTSNMLTWTLYFLCEHPEWQERLFAELTATQKSAAELSRKDLEALKLHRSVLQEAMRLLPPIPVISRMTREPDVLSGYPIGAGVSVLCVPYVTHRDPRYWAYPTQFDPMRFVNREERKDDFHFFPFARGSRSCIGEELAMVEATMILAHFIESYRWKLQADFIPKPNHHLTLRSDNGLMVVCETREN